jgi:hypothetical protein
MNLNLPSLVLASVFGGWEVLLIVVSMLCFVFWIWMIVDCAIRETVTETKVIWLVIIIFGWIFGAPIYYVVRKFPRYFAPRPPAPDAKA